MINFSKEEHQEFIQRKHHTIIKDHNSYRKNKKSDSDQAGKRKKYKYCKLFLITTKELDI
jgi:hypothetical protein